jgi:hypothetical protein
VESLQRKPDSLTLVRVIRQPDKEKELFDQLSGSGFGLKRAPLPSKSGLFRLRARTHPVDFLLNALPRLAQAGYEIYGEEKLKTARVNRNTPTILPGLSDRLVRRASVDFRRLKSDAGYPPAIANDAISNYQTARSAKSKSGWALPYLFAMRSRKRGCAFPATTWL